MRAASNVDFDRPLNLEQASHHKPAVPPRIHSKRLQAHLRPIRSWARAAGERGSIHGVALYLLGATSFR